MTDINELKQKNDRMFILVCLNFAMLVFLSGALGYVALSSATLVRDLKAGLQKAEQAVAELKGKIQSVDTDLVMGQVVDNATETIKGSISTAIEKSNLTGPFNDLTEKVENTQQRLEETSEAIRDINKKLQDVDTEQLAQLVSYNMLKGLGDGFTHAAESRKPDM